MDATEYDRLAAELESALSAASGAIEWHVKRWADVAKSENRSVFWVTARPRMETTQAVDVGTWNSKYREQLVTGLVQQARYIFEHQARVGK